MDVFVARQPIFDRQKHIFAYELLFRTGGSNRFPDIDGETATSSLLSSSFFTVGIDKIGAGKNVYINFTENLLEKGAPLLFPPQKMIVEILEDVRPSPEIIASCKDLKSKGYTLALDDFIYSKEFDELLHHSDIVKIGFHSTSLPVIEKMLQAVEPYNCKLLAEKVENYADFDKALNLGFDYFQGYFFSKPEVLKNRDLSASQMSMIRLLWEINTAGYDLDAIEGIVKQDIAIAYKLLTYINSAHFSRVQPLTSVRHAISFLGERKIKLFISLIATSKLAENKPDELTRLSITRARFFELIGIELKQDSSKLFLLGLFSLLDAMLDQNMQDIVGKMSLSNDLSEALARQGGNLLVFLRLVESYEAGDWSAFEDAQKELGLGDENITDFYVDALAWADSFNLL